MNSFLEKFLQWKPIWQAVFLIGPLAIYFVNNQVGILPNFPYSSGIYGVILFSSLVLSLVWPLSIERIVLKKAPKALQEQLRQQLPKKGAKIFFFIAISVLIVSVFFSLPFFEESLTPRRLIHSRYNQDFNEVKSTFAETAKIAGIIVLIMLFILLLFLVQLLIYAKLARRSAIILTSIEENRMVEKNHCKKEFWLFFAVPIGVFLLNKRIVKIVNPNDLLSENEKIIDV